MKTVNDVYVERFEDAIQQWSNVATKLKNDIDESDDEAELINRLAKHAWSVDDALDDIESDLGANHYAVVGCRAIWNSDNTGSVIAEAMRAIISTVDKHPL